MGKIRVKTLGNEQKEKLDKKKSKERSLAKKVIETKPQPDSQPQKDKKEQVAKPQETTTQESEKVEKPKASEKNKKTKTSRKPKHSHNYLALAKMFDKNKKHALKEALEILPKLSRKKFDETVELHINTHEKSLSGNLTLPHGTGKKIRVEIANQTEDPKHVEEIVKKVEKGNIDFDVLIATPDSMPKLARIAKTLGPRGLMPNPKSGTVTPKPDEIAKKFQGGQINYKTEAKSPIIHLSVGKVSFGEKKLTDNIKTAIITVQTKNIKNITLKSTMSPGIKLDFAAMP
jgi:large subunit ribosomal protein L1